MKRATWVRVGLSVFLVFHVFALMLAPNSRTYLTSVFGWIVQPYVTVLELGSSWSFFAPDPGPPPVFVEYELVGDEGATIGSGTWPERKDPYFLRELQNRRIGVARFFMIDPKRTERMMGPYYCRLNPKARSVRLWHVIENIPNLHDVAAGKRAIGDKGEVQRKFVTQFVCEGRV